MFDAVLMNQSKDHSQKIKKSEVCKVRSKTLETGTDISIYVDTSLENIPDSSKVVCLKIFFKKKKTKVLINKCAWKLIVMFRTVRALF